MLSLSKNLACGIGSLPYKDQKQAVDFVLSCFKNDIIFWPQLPKRSFLEQMTVQFCERFPGVNIDINQGKIYIDTKKPAFTQELEGCFQHYLDDDLEYFNISKEFACGLYEFTERLAAVAGAHEFIKGQIVGPITLGMMLLTDEKEPVIYNPDLKDALVKTLSMKARWQIKKLQAASCKPQANEPKPKIIIFIDEPYLVSFGSSFFTLKKEEVIGIIDEIIDAIHKDGAACGIHCCANTDWSVILSTKVDILSFDAYGYLDNLLLYKSHLSDFISRGGILSFGIVPNDEETLKQGKKEELVVKIKKAVKDMAITSKALITPSCGCGSLDVGFSEKIHRLCAAIAEDLG